MSSGGGQGGQGLGDAWVAGAQGDEPDLAVVELGQHGLGGELRIEDQQRRVGPGDGLPVVGERDDFPVLAGLGQVGVGIQQRVGGWSSAKNVSTERVRWDRRGT